ncbi:MAG TPA: TolC family protein [Gemmataceae bacterium]|nr:TolC family protein [Gemmataceae bacterium]
MIVLLVACGAVLGQAQQAASPPTGSEHAATATKSSPAKPEDGKPSELEQMLTEALANNPDIRVSEAKLREAEAELNRVRLQALQKLATFHHSLEAQRAAVKAAEASMQQIQKKIAVERVDPEDVHAAQSQLSQEKAKLATLENEIPFLLGRPPQSNSSSQSGAGSGDSTSQNFFALFGVRNPHSWGHGDSCTACHDTTGSKMLHWVQQFHKSHADFMANWFEAGVLAPGQSAQGALADKIRKQLDAPVNVDVRDQPLSVVLKILEEPGINFHNALPRSVSESMHVTLHLQQVPLGAVLQALEDTLTDRQVPRTRAGDVCFAVREYGILVTTRGQLPLGATLVHDFWKGRADKEQPTWVAGPDKVGTANPPPQDIEGTIRATDPKSGMVTLSIGSDAGLRKGHTLEVYRLKPEPKYLGSLEVVSVTSAEAVARLIQNRGVKLEVGDRVTSAIRRR